LGVSVPLMQDGDLETVAVYNRMVQAMYTAYGSTPNGTAATADITTSTTDITAGRLLKVGDFGIGGIPATYISSDLNGIESGGTYYVYNNANAPLTGAGSVATLKVEAITGNDTNQIWTNRLGRRFFRSQNSSTWTAWREIYHTGNLLGTVSQSAGVPTGAVIETGSNVNGSYTKFADGTMICAHNKSVTPASVISNFYGSTAGNIYNSGVDWYFAATFITAPEVVCTGDNTFAQIATAPTTTKVRLQAQEQASGTPVTIRAFAIGRWF